MKKKLYIKPLCQAVEVETSSMVCMSIHDEEVPMDGPIGAKHNTFHDDFEESEDFNEE